MNSPLVIVFEGIDGTGKTTVSNQVARQLRKRDLEVLHLREGGTYGNDTAEAVRQITRDRRLLGMCVEAELYLNLARERETTRWPDEQALEDVDVIIADRFRVSYEILARARGMEVTQAQSVVALLEDQMVPDRILVFDLPSTDARIRKRVGKVGQAAKVRLGGRKGLLGEGLAARQRALYLEIAANDPERYRVLDVRFKDIEAVTHDALVALEDIIPKAKKAAKKLGQGRRVEGVEDRLMEAAQQEDGQMLVDSFFGVLSEIARVDGGLALGLISNMDDPKAWDLRERLTEKFPAHVAASLSGMGDERAIKMLEKLAPKQPRAVVRALGGRINPVARQILQTYRAQVPDAVLEAIAGRDDEEAWELRTRLFEEIPHLGLRSLRGLDDERAWTKRVPFEHTSDPLLGDALARSLSGIETEHAWVLRDRMRAVGPAGVVLSLRKLTDSRSIALRQAYIDSAPKIVLRTIIGSDEDWAWSLRKRAGSWAKEVLDSIDAIEGERAWSLRHELASIFPSTAVSSLGAGDHSVRSWAFRWAQLREFPGNLLLAKHLVRALQRDPKKEADSDA